jgi:hypothetical protein
MLTGPLAFFSRLKWIDGRPLLGTIEPYRRRLFEQFFALNINLLLSGRAKKNFKTADLVLAALYALLADSPGGNQVYIVANDLDQAGDDLELARLLLRKNPALEALLVERKNTIERRDGKGVLEVLPAQDAIGAHGKTYRFLGVDEIHGYRSWDLLEALAPDPTRHDCQQWITSYATLFHKPGVPLFDLLQLAKGGTDPRMLLSWYAADFCTDVDFADKSAEERANPSMASWGSTDYLAQQRRRLPAHKYRRLHLNLPGTPEGSAYQPDPVFDSIARGVKVRPPQTGIDYEAFVDMSGGSSDDAVLGIAHQDANDRAILDRLLDQGARAPFDPRKAVERFVAVLREYRCSRVTGDAYAGNTFRSDFENAGITYEVSERSKSQLYEDFEPLLNGGRVVLLDHSELEQQLLGLVWRGGRIDHLSGEHDDHANGAVGACCVAVHRLPPLIFM